MPLDILSLVSTVARQFLGTLLFNVLFIVLYIVILTLIKKKLEKQFELRQNATGTAGKTTRQMIEEIILVCLVTGFITSIAVVFAGIVLDMKVFQYIFLIMIFLFLINPRLVCFSYAGGLLALYAALFGIPEFNPAGLIALAATVHVAESVLILLFGAKDTIPVYIKHRDGIAGAFIIQRFWPLPLVFIATGIQSVAGGGIEGLIKAPWWPLFGQYPTGEGIAALGLGCLAAFLSYSDMAVSRNPEEKVRETALLNLGYSAVIFTFAYFARGSVIVQISGALAVIILHEAVSVFGRLREMRRKPLFKAERRGLKVFDIAPGGHAWQMGIRRGDTILSVNDMDIQTTGGLTEILKKQPSYLWVRIITPGGIEKLLEYRHYSEGVNDLGILTVPRELEVTYSIDHFENFTIIKNLVARFRSVGNIER